MAEVHGDASHGSCSPACSHEASAVPQREAAEPSSASTGELCSWGGAELLPQPALARPVDAW